MEKNKIFIVIPAYNEGRHIALVIKDLLNYNYKIVVVDDASEDNTFEIAKQFPITVLKHKINRGQGAALQTGTDFALKNNAQVIVHFDGDGQFLAKEIERVIALILSENVDIVLGSRFLSKHKTQITEHKYKIPFLKKYFILPISRIVNYFFTGLNLTDAHCGFRAMNKKAAEKIRVTQDRMSHNTEIVAQIKKLKLKYKEIPVTVIYHEFGQGISGGFKILKELILGKIIK